MFWLRRRDVFDIGKATLLWLGLGVSVGGYYAFSGNGLGGWPLPFPEACGAWILDHFSTAKAPGEYGSLQWLLLFPIAGLIWVSVLSITAPFFGGRRVEYMWTIERLSVTCLPLLIPLPLIIYFFVKAFSRATWRLALTAGLQRLGYVPHQWLTPVYLTLTVIALVWQIYLYTKIFDLRGKAACRHYVFSLGVSGVLASGMAVVVSIPLQAWFR